MTANNEKFQRRKERKEIILMVILKFISGKYLVGISHSHHIHIKENFIADSTLEKLFKQ
jgi:hypothetical protein